MTPATSPGLADLPTPILSVLHLDPHHPQVRADTRDVQTMHARVVSMLGIDPDQPKGRELWAHPRPDRLLVQWKQPVDPHRLPAGWTLAATHAVTTGWQVGQSVTWSARDAGHPRGTSMSATAPTAADQPAVGARRLPDVRDARTGQRLWSRCQSRVRPSIWP